VHARSEAQGAGVSRSASHVAERLLERFRFVHIELDHEPTATFERDAHHKPTSLFGDFQRTVARPRLHRRHARTYPSSFSAETPPD